MNSHRNIIKVFKPFEDISKISRDIDAIEINYDCFIKEEVKPFGQLVSLKYFGKNKAI